MVKKSTEGRALQTPVRGVSRHTLLTVLYAEAAQKLGYSFEDSGTAAVTIATGIAVFKNGGRKSKKTSETLKAKSTSSSFSADDPLFENLSFVELGGFAVVISPNHTGTLYTRNRKGEYRKTSITGKFSQFEWKFRQIAERYPELYEKILETVSTLSDDVIRSRKLFEVYKQLRNEVGL